MKKRYDRADLPERLQYTKYYEHDGMLRAYANRAMVLAMLFAVIATASLGFAIYVRVQPPTVVRVDAEGRATSIGAVQGSVKPRPLSRSRHPVILDLMNSKPRRLCGGFWKTIWLVHRRPLSKI